MCILRICLGACSSSSITYTMYFSNIFRNLHFSVLVMNDAVSIF